MGDITLWFMVENMPKAGRTAIEWTLLITCSLVALFVWMPETDPINLPKFALLLLGASILAGFLALPMAKNMRTLGGIRIPLLLLILFLLVLLISSLVSDYPYTAFFGAFQRNNGFLSSLGLALLLLAAASVIRAGSAKRFLAALAIVGGIEAVYGFTQHFGLDPLSWNNPYNSVVGTLGNPDFMSAFLGIAGLALLWFAIDGQITPWLRITSAALLLLALLDTVYSQARQGLLAFAVGATVLAITWLFQRSRTAGVAALVFAGFLAVAGTLGMLQVGPLSRFLYKISITYRGDYWRAGFRMFRSHPFLGVGPDRYGDFFRQYRDATQVLRRGPELTSDAAHSVFIQIAATGGIFAFLIYLLLTGTIAWFGFRALKTSSGNSQLLVAALIGAWLAYQVQSAISIDTLGIAAWGWALGGAVVGLAQPEFVERVSVKTRKKTKKSKGAQRASGERPQSVSILIASTFAVISLILTVPMVAADLAMRVAQQLKPASQSGADLAIYKSAVMRAPNIRPSEPQYEDNAAQLLFLAGLFDDGRVVAKKAVRMNPRDYWAWYYLALSYENLKNRPAAVAARQRIAAIDPFNAPSLLELGRDLKAAGQSVAAKAIVTRIDSFAPNSQEAKSAQAEFGG